MLLYKKLLLMTFGTTLVYLKETVCDDMEWINPAQYNDRKIFLAKDITKIRVQ